MKEWDSGTKMGDFGTKTSDLAPIRVEHADTFIAACNRTSALTHRHYFPSLYFDGGRNHLRWESHGESIIVYQIRRQADRRRMSLLLPPFPFGVAALRHAVERMQDFNKGQPGRIIWVAEADALAVARENFAVYYKEDDYIFDRAAVMAHAGSAFKKLRQELSRAERAGDLVTTRPYRALDLSACVALANSWKERLNAAGISAIGYNMTLNCLARAHEFDAPLLIGRVVEVDGTVRGFAFGGQTSDAMGSNFLSVTDTRFRGLPYLLCYHLMEAHPDLSHFNDSTDGGRDGLREQKRRFQPIALQCLYGARIR
jgi:hypothetical protein